ncbi:protein disulfide isomerase pTAC5, chloroplastic [Malania oleifera]|uniref:protein disulfide isomerase pTAC5, chloroplastic n=1 Tax=Malania oleifera TaxID=397392 RepID=UPI0025ADBF8D|nr:protein disulfide isomerase pTAC5, chloroplastic [Malania oleifera]
MSSSAARRNFIARLESKYIRAPDVFALTHSPPHCSLHLVLMSSSSLPLPLTSPPPFFFHKPLAPLHFTLSPFPISKPSSFSFTAPHSYASASPPNPSNFDPEEQRWLREEQRWIREEQRWLREEQRWNSERELLLREISDLKLKIRALEQQNSVQGASVSETLAKVAALLQVLKDSDLAKSNRIAESGSGPKPIVMEAAESEEVKAVVVKEVVGVSGGDGGEKTVKKKKALRKGSEGENVRAMQEALQRLGFYSGEEDMEYSSFSSGTERAVKTWQSTLGAPEDGIMTAELLERLFMGQQGPIVLQKDGANGAPVASVEISEIQQTIVEEKGVTEVEVSQQRVFLLGENRWEEPSRLVGRDQQVAGSKTTKCVACRGEGRLLCMECDGTGEPNIEPQFMEWVDEGMKCPYCEGCGYTVCDVCDGKKIVV